MELFDLSDVEERVLLVGVQERDGDDTEESLQELAELAKTAGAKVVGTVIQKREAIHPGTYVGKGKMSNPRKTDGDNGTYLFDIHMENELPEYLQYDFGLTKE